MIPYPQFAADLASLHAACEAFPRDTPINKTAESARLILMRAGRKDVVGRMFNERPPAAWRYGAPSKRAFDAMLAEFFEVSRADRAGRPLAWTRKI